MNQSMKAGAIPSLSYIRRCSKCLLWFLFIDNLNTVPGAKSPNVIHILTTKSLPEKNITSTIFIKQEIKEIFSVLDPRTEVQNKAYARSIHQLCCEAFSMHGSVLFNWNYWQHFDRSKACAWRVLSETVLLVNKGKKNHLISRWFRKKWQWTRSDYDTFWCIFKAISEGPPNSTMLASNHVFSKWRGYVWIKSEAEMNKANELNEAVIYQIAFSIICFSEDY